MTKLIVLLFVLAMGLHVLKPFDVPLLRKRSDFWKIAVIGLVIMLVAITLRP